MFFDFTLPEHLIAQTPAARRDEARLLVVHRDTGRLEHRIVRDLPQLLSRGDLVVLNDSKVLPARLLGTRLATGGKWEGLFLRDHAVTWELLAQTRGFAKPGEIFRTETGLTLTLCERTADRHWLMRPEKPGPANDLLLQFGRVPLPPYIRKGIAANRDEERYQTVYAKALGSVAAPTAGLHFTPELLESLSANGIERANVTLHVGLGTFAPIKASDPTQHQIHEEWCEADGAAVAAIRETKSRGGRVIAIGTTTTRTLETAAANGSLQPFRGESKLFIHPPFAFRVVDGLLTNFHLPRTSLLLLAQSLSGSEL